MTPRGWLVRVALTTSLLAAACGPTAPGGPGDPASDAQPGSADGSGECRAGVGRCEGSDYQTCVDGRFVTQETCAGACDRTHGCVTCAPGSSTCTGDVARTCRDDGSGYDEIACDPVQGMSCDAASGRCAGACAPQSIGSSYIGCEYYPTVTANNVDNRFAFAVAISNTGTAPA